MSFQAAGYSLYPVIPELVLAVGAMLLLMLGAYRKDAAGAVIGLSVALLAVVAGLVIWLPVQTATFGNSFIVDGFARYMKFLVLGGSAFALVLSTSTAKPRMRSWPRARSSPACRRRSSATSSPRI